MTTTLEIDGRIVEIEIVDKTRPLADRRYQCCWNLKPEHWIEKGERYVRMVVKVNGEFRSDHVFLECFTTPPENGI